VCRSRGALVADDRDPEGVDRARISKRLSYVLRLTRAELDAVVAGNDKQRFAFDGTGTRIRIQPGAQRRGRPRV
jgi:putative RNA 2'-phosphotransferase